MIKSKIKSNIFIFYILALIVIIMGAISTIYLPDKYFFDANLIVNDPDNEKGLMGSYSFAMWVYDFFWINRLHYSLVAFIQLPIIFYCLKRIGIPNGFGIINIRNIIIWLSLLMFAVYLSMPSKEFINFLYIQFICLILVSDRKLKTKVSWAILLFLFFGFWYRPYYTLIPIIALGIYLSGRIKLKNRAITNVLAGILVVCFISLSYGVLKGKYITQNTRERLNEVRIGREDSQTIILSPVEPNNIINEGVSILYGFMSVNIPVNGLAFIKKPQVIAFVVWQITMFALILISYKKCLDHRNYYRHEQWVFHFLISYLIIQGVFEPDLGSAVKHKLGVFPLIYLALYFDQLKFKP